MDHVRDVVQRLGIRNANLQDIWDKHKGLDNAKALEIELRKEYDMGESVMRISEKRLRQIIKEELASLTEIMPPRGLSKNPDEAAHAGNLGRQDALDGKKAKSAEELAGSPWNLDHKWDYDAYMDAYMSAREEVK